jgi:hypothetical protein
MPITSSPTSVDEGVQMNMPSAKSKKPLHGLTELGQPHPGARWLLFRYQPQSNVVKLLARLDMHL